MGTSLSMYKGASDHCKVHRGFYVGTSSMFLDLALCIPLVSSFGIFVIFASYQLRAGHPAYTITQLAQSPGSHDHLARTIT